jgi:hypothetical protein
MASPFLAGLRPPLAPPGSREHVSNPTQTELGVARVMERA